MKTLILFLIISINTQAQDTWQFAPDKQKHFAVGSVSSAIVTGVTKKHGVIFGLSMGVLLGAGKELIYDKAMDKGQPSYQDFGYTVIGSVVGTFVTYGIKKLIQKKNNNYI